ncbi:hypothetical protein [Halomonas sp. PA16-9]|uniref:hypothetical protein n=1 Tax=Halomonas sp. PA16-9 TaxID=2576841 RepID=UPI0030EEA5BF
MPAGDTLCDQKAGLLSDAQASFRGVGEYIAVILSSGPLTVNDCVAIFQSALCWPLR